MSRDAGLFLEDILEACLKIQQLQQGMDRTRFAEDWRDRDAILHNLEVIGEAVKRLPKDMKDSVPSVPWKRIAAFRDVLAHGISRWTMRL